MQEMPCLWGLSLGVEKVWGGQVPRSSSNSMGSPEAMATHSSPAYPRRGRGAPGQGWAAAGAQSAQLWGHRHFLLGEAAPGGGRHPRGSASCSHRGGGSVRFPSGAGSQPRCGTEVPLSFPRPKWDLGQSVLLTPVVRAPRSPLELGPQLRNSLGPGTGFTKPCSLC